MRLVTRYDAHAAQRRGYRGLIDGRLLVVLARDHLLVVRIRPFDQSRKDQRAAGAEADMVVTLGELDLGIAGIEPANLLERLGWDDQVGGGAASRGHVQDR